MNEAALMVLGEGRRLGRELAALRHFHPALACREEFLRIHDHSDLDDTIDFAPVHVASHLIADGVDILADDLVIAKVLHTDGRHGVQLDDFHPRIPLESSARGPVSRKRVQLGKLNFQPVVLLGAAA
jgi:hypothetical protein